MNSGLGLRSIAEERAARLKSRNDEGAESPELFERSLREFGDEELAIAARGAYAFARGLEYDHPGMSPSSYLAHPVRLVAMTLKLDAKASADAVILALLHNAFEVSRVAPAEISKRFGDHIASAMQALTVDRASVSPEYTARYYRDLNAYPRFVKSVKILDKLDNLFTLGLNPSESVRTAYLNDIDEFVLPMVVETLPNLTDYFLDLVADVRSAGFFGTDP